MHIKFTYFCLYLWNNFSVIGLLNYMKYSNCIKYKCNSALKKDIIPYFTKAQYVGSNKTTLTIYCYFISYFTNYSSYLIRICEPISNLVSCMAGCVKSCVSHMT